MKIIKNYFKIQIQDFFIFARIRETYCMPERQFTPIHTLLREKKDGTVAEYHRDILKS